MHQFLVFDQNGPATSLELAGSYGIGAEGAPTRADCQFAGGQLRLSARGGGAVGLALLWPIAGFGKVMVETTRLPARKKPYVLNVELARWRLQRVLSKREEWGLIDYPGAEAFNEQIEEAQSLFIASLKQLKKPAAAARSADEALLLAMRAGEQMALFHGKAFLGRRRQTAGLPGSLLGVHVDLFSLTDPYREALLGAGGLAVLPMTWKSIEPKEQEFDLQRLEAWVKLLTARGVAIKAASVVSLAESDVPDWLYIWQNDFESLRDMVYEHVKMLVTRFGKYVKYWGAVRGLNRHNSLNLTFDQLIELTRLTAQAIKKADPEANVVLDLVQPWGEYYARGPRTIPPQLYVDFAGQSNVPFDGVGVEMLFGVNEEGHFCRDLLQVSALLDRYANLGKSLHISAVQVPSAVSPDNWDHWRGGRSVADGGAWHAPWSEQIQAEWLEAFYTIAASKPFVETICWRDLADYEGHYLPHGGLMHNNLAAKPAYKKLTELRGQWTTAGPVVIDQQQRRGKPAASDWDLIE